MAVCEECGAELPEGLACVDLFHALLAREWEAPGGNGPLTHFYLVSSYILQHPSGMNFTAKAVEGLSRSLQDALNGKATLDELRERARSGAAAAGRVIRRDGEQPPILRRWRMTVEAVYHADLESFQATVATWARSLSEALNQKDHAG